MGKVYATTSDTNRFKQLRKKTGLTQAEVASHLNLVTSTISKWETGITTPDQTILFKLAELYNCSIEFLLGKADNNLLSDFQILHTRTNFKNIICLYDNSGDVYKYEYSADKFEEFKTILSALTKISK